MDNDFFKKLINKYRKEPYLSELEITELNAFLKKYKIKKNEACLFLGVEYQAFNRHEKNVTMPRMLLDFFRFAESAQKLAKIEEDLK